MAQAECRRRGADHDRPLARQYQAHLRARLRTTPGGDAVTVPDRLEEDDRPLVRGFRTFLPVFLAHCGAPPEVAGNDVHFPSIRFFDARAVE